MTSTTVNTPVRGAPRVDQIGALDGIRGFAVGIAVWFHLRVDQMPGGLVAISIFFPLSGFLITRLMLIEYGRTEAVLLGRFWQRRARRLIPAHYVLLFFVTIVLIVTGTHEGSDWGATQSSIFYFNNWWQLSQSVDYWAQFTSRESPFKHLWSLSVEEQVYFAWPLVTVAVLKWARRPLLALGTVALALAAAGVAYGFVIAALGHGGATAVYYNTAVRSAELLVGAALAVLFVARPNVWTSPRSRQVLDVVAGVCLSAIAFLALSLDESVPRFIADGGMFAVALVTVVVIAAAVRGGTVAAVLTIPPLRWLGTRCYSLYLWHWPIITLCTTENSGLTGWWLTSLQIALTLSATVLSYWLIEERFRRARPRRQAGVTTS